MKTLIIVARDSMLSDLENLLQENGVKAYTIMSNVMGKGVTGRVFGTFLNPDTNAIIFCGPVPRPGRHSGQRPASPACHPQSVVTGHPHPSQGVFLSL